MPSQPIQIRRAIFQGLSLAITSCIALIPFTKELNKTDCGYQVHGTERKVSHLLYTDDWKLLGRSEDDLENEIYTYIVTAIIKHININFGLEKCEKICFFFFKKKLGSSGEHT